MSTNELVERPNRKGSIGRLSSLPYWPTRMGEDTAALYLDISKSGFRNRWTSDKGFPQPVRQGGRRFWSREQLDQWVRRCHAVDEEDHEIGGGGRTKGWGK